MYSFPINYIPPVYRPPSEARSLLLQVTLGCSHNKCVYCDMYRSKNYSIRSFEDIESDIIRCYESGILPQKIFLCDGDALGAPTELLEKVLLSIQKYFPECRRVGVYATGNNILRKTDDELKRLNQVGLGIAYLGLESGDDEVLHLIVKGNSADEMREASLKVKRCGIKLSTIAMLGVGGINLSSKHIKGTAKLISETCPDYFSFLTTTILPNTPLNKMVERGLFRPLTTKMLLSEMHDILSFASFDLNTVVFRANHVSNQFPLAGIFPRDKEKVLEQIREWIEQTPEDTYPPQLGQL